MSTYYRVFVNVGPGGASVKETLGELALLMVTDYEEAETARDAAKRAGLVDGQFVIVPIFPVS